MMSKEKRRVPKLRFPGFTEDWEQRKLGDYLTIPEKEILEVASVNDLITVKLNLGGVESGASRDTLSLGSTVYYKRYAGQFIYGKQNFFNGSMGLIPKNLDGKGSSGDVPSFNVSNIEANYLYTYVSRESYWRLKVAAASGTGSKRIHEKTFLDFNIDVPSLDEQKLISNTFDLVNRFITLHQRKLNNLKLKKKALLQKLFPKNGERYPELRFPGFTDAWEQRKFGDLFEYERPDAYIVKSDNYNDDFNMPVLTANKAFILGYTNEENSYNKPSIIFDDFTLDRKYVDFPYMLKSSAIKILTSKNQHNLRFLFERLNSTRFELLGHARHYISVVQNTITFCPSVEEEVCISNLLTKFDELITLHQRKLDHLQLQKKALLQQMFV